MKFKSVWLFPILYLSLTLVALTEIGCHKGVVSAPVPGQINSFDATSYRVLLDTQASIDSVKKDVAAGTITLTDTQKTVLNQVIADYNVGEAAWKSYHSGATADTAGLTSAINTLVADIAKIVTEIKGAK